MVESTDFFQQGSLYSGILGLAYPSLAEVREKTGGLVIISSPLSHIVMASHGLAYDPSRFVIVCHSLALIPSSHCSKLWISPPASHPWSPCSCVLLHSSTLSTAAKWYAACLHQSP
jgi:hypothetical protein